MNIEEMRKIVLDDIERSYDIISRDADPIRMLRYKSSMPEYIRDSFIEFNNQKSRDRLKVRLKPTGEESEFADRVQQEIAKAMKTIPFQKKKMHAIVLLIYATRAKHSSGFGTIAKDVSYYKRISKATVSNYIYNIVDQIIKNRERS